MQQIAKAGHSQHNACRNLHSLIHRKGITLPLRIHTVEIPIRKKKPKLLKEWVHYPVILPRTWFSYLLENHSKLILAGHNINNEKAWKGELTKFWDAYLPTDLVHPMHSGGPPRSQTIPVYIHGDEGRGKKFLPLMVQCIQPAISFRGPDFKNSSGYLDPICTPFVVMYRPWICFWPVYDWQAVFSIPIKLL